MVELHANLTANGSKTVENGIQPTHHAVHETLEVTHGFTDWFETGFYVFSSIQPEGGWQWVGDHIPPRLAIPESGIGRSGSASRRNLVTSSAVFLPTPGLGDSPYPRQDQWAAGISPSIPPSSALCTARTCTRALSVLDERFLGICGFTMNHRTKLMS